MKGKKSEDCKTCLIYSVCPIEFNYCNIKCPCWCCIVKVMCRASCSQFNTYLNNYIMYSKKMIKTVEDNKLVPSPADIFNIREIRP